MNLAALRTENEVLKGQTAEWRQKHDALLAVPGAPHGNASCRGPAYHDNITPQKQAALWKQLAQSNQPPAAQRRGTPPCLLKPSASWP